MKNVGIRMTLLAGALSVGVLVAAPRAMVGTTLSVSRAAGVSARGVHHQRHQPDQPTNILASVPLTFG